MGTLSPPDAAIMLFNWNSLLGRSRAVRHIASFGRELGVQKRWRFIAVAIFLAAGLWHQASPGICATPAEERAKLRTAEGLVKKAGKLYTAKNYTEAADTVREAQDALAELEKSEIPAMSTPVASLRKNVIKARKLLLTQKVELPDLPPAGISASGGKKAAIAEKTSFTKQIVPILVSRCGKCHVDSARGGFSMVSYAKLIEGGKDGIVVQAGSGKGSRIYEVIESGDMPRGGGTVLPEELALLVRWIDEGAPFDGRDPADRLNAASATAMASAAPPTKAAPAKMASSEKNPGDKKARGTAKKTESETPAEEVLFARDIAPVIVDKCLDCHGDRNPRGQLNLTSFKGLMDGGRNGATITANNPSGSLLIEKLRGTADGERMPMGKPALSDELIAKIEKWIAGGSKFDGIDPGMSLVRLAAMVKAQNSTHEDLVRDRAQLTEKNWHLVLPDSHGEHVDTEHFLIYGNVSAEELAEIGSQAEALVPKIEKLLKVPSGQPLIKGKMTIYAFRKHYDYGEIGTMLEHREIPAESAGHWHYDVVDAYAAVVPPKNSDYGLDVLLAQQIASVYIANQGTVPHWFADGAGRALASKINPKDSRVRQWETRQASALSVLGKPTDMLDGKLNPGDGEALTYGFVKSLMGNAGRFYGLLSNLRGGAAFDDAFARAYGGPPNQVVGSWAQRGGGKKW
jgi:mono/diheme cytochrome c family protein